LDDCIKKIVLLFSIFVFFNLQAYAAGDEAYEKLKLMIDVMEIIGKNYVSETNPKKFTSRRHKGRSRFIGSVFAIYGRKSL
jgi:hypothetical protein